MTVRPAKKEDIPAVAALEAEIFPEGASAEYLTALGLALTVIPIVEIEKGIRRLAMKHHK